jgi:hypothetical protein
MERWTRRYLKAEHALTKRGDALQRGLRCAWCNKPLETEDFAVELIFPVSSEAMKRSMLDSLLGATPKEVEVLVEEHAIGVLYRFCCETHKNEFVRMAEADGVTILKV